MCVYMYIIHVIYLFTLYSCAYTHLNFLFTEPWLIEASGNTTCGPILWIASSASSYSPELCA